MAGNGSNDLILTASVRNAPAQVHVLTYSEYCAVIVMSNLLKVIAAFAAGVVVALGGALLYVHTSEAIHPAGVVRSALATDPPVQSTAPPPEITPWTAGQTDTAAGKAGETSARRRLKNRSESTWPCRRSTPRSGSSRSRFAKHTRSRRSHPDRAEYASGKHACAGLVCRAAFGRQQPVLTSASASARLRRRSIAAEHRDRTRRPGLAPASHGYVGGWHKPDHSPRRNSFHRSQLQRGHIPRYSRQPSHHGRLYHRGQGVEGARPHRRGSKGRTFRGYRGPESHSHPDQHYRWPARRSSNQQQ